MNNSLIQDSLFDTNRPKSLYLFQVIAMSTEHPSFSGGTATALSDSKVSRPRPVKHGVALAIRKGTLGLGPDLAVAGQEISEDGLRARIKSELKEGDEVEMSLTAVGRSKPMKLVGDVRWCQKDDTDRSGRTFAVGIQFRHRLAFSEIGQFL
jgi:PilZ domain